MRNQQNANVRMFTDKKRSLSALLELVRTGRAVGREVPTERLLPQFWADEPLAAFGETPSLPPRWTRGRRRGLRSQRERCAPRGGGKSGRERETRS